MTRPLRVWIDLANSPHVHVFRPIVDELVARGHEVEITARDFAQTVGMASRLGWDFKVIGRHGGKNLARKSAAVIGRSVGLVRYGANRCFDVALHHNSYAHALSASVLRIPSVAMMDYEYQPANHLSFRLARRVLVPAPFPVEALAACGAAAKADWYPGIKEEIYLADFEPDPSALRGLGIAENDQRIIVLMRPAPTMAAYHRFENPLFDAIVADLTGRDDVLLIMLPRTPEQRVALEPFQSPSCIVPDHVVDALSLICLCDLLVGAGGTMNREAAVLGTPVYTVFAGKTGAVDRHLVEQGRMCVVEAASDVAVRPRERRTPMPRGADLAAYVVDAVEATAANQWLGLRASAFARSGGSPRRPGESDG